MKERPIIFSTESVRAIFAGEKTQTRRVMKPQPEAYLENEMWWEKKRKGRVVMGSVYPKDWAEYSPFGVPGDRLWVKETWCNLESADHYKADIVYKADEHELPKCVKWKSPLFMPRELSPPAA
jgi:hypothetical protein